MTAVQIKSINGSVIGELAVNPELFETAISPKLLRDAYVMYETNRRQGTAKTKTKGEISGSKKKLFRQKGTGNARMGQKRTPVRVGGGNAFGKKPKDWTYRLPKKALRTATRMALAGKLEAGSIVVLDEINLNKPSTAEIARLLKTFGANNKRCLIVSDAHNSTLLLSTRNIQHLTLTTALCLNSRDLLGHRNILMTRSALEKCLERLSKA